MPPVFALVAPFLGSKGKGRTAAPGLCGEETPGRPHDLVRRRLPGGASHPWLAGPQRGDPGATMRWWDIGGLL